MKLVSYLVSQKHDITSFCVVTVIVRLGLASFTILQVVFLSYARSFQYLVCFYTI
jgi:hypothetical protein